MCGRYSFNNKLQEAAKILHASENYNMNLVLLSLKKITNKNIK